MSKATKIAQAIKSYAAFLKAGASYGEAMQAAAKALGGTPCPTLLEGLARVHARKYECNYTWNGSGSAVFHTGKESSRDTRHDAAHKSWQRNVMVFFKTEEPKPQTHARLDAGLRAEAMAYLATFEGKTLDEQIRKAKAVFALL
jgi:hypothetical protein